MKCINGEHYNLIAEHAINSQTQTKTVLATWPSQMVSCHMIQYDQHSWLPISVLHKLVVFPLVFGSLHDSSWRTLQNILYLSEVYILRSPNGATFSFTLCRRCADTDLKLSKVYGSTFSIWCNVSSFILCIDFNHFKLSYAYFKYSQVDIWYEGI